jgi:dihydroorotate dehydrogenase (NAD+) catalytic subunit
VGEVNATKLERNIAGVTFQNPVIAASGTFGYGKEYAELVDLARLGGLVSKGLTLRPRQGNKGQRLWETPSGLLNSIGLENPGIEAFIRDDLPFLKSIGENVHEPHALRPVIIANLAGESLEDYRDGAALLDKSSVDMVELNISCPNVKAGGMSFGLDPESAGSVTNAVRKALPSKPLIAKLTPNAPDVPAVGLACVDAGADALSLTNTFLGMAIDIRTRRPVFDNVTAGLSGPAIRPLALRMVWDVCRAVDVPVIGIGGIDSADAARQFLLAGAKAVEVGSAIFSRPTVLTEIINGLKQDVSEG